MLSAPKIREVPAHHEAIENIACTTGDLPEKLNRAYGEIENWAADKRVRISAPFARYRFFSTSACRVEAGYIFEGNAAGDEQIRVQDEGGYTALTAEHTGPYATISKAYEALEEFMRIHGYASAGAPVEYYLTPPETPPQAQRAEIVWPVIPNEL